MTHILAQQLRDRADWFKRERENGGDAAHLSAREVECRHIALLADREGERVTAELNAAMDKHFKEVGGILERYTALINSPELEHFLRGTHIEAIHQVERWGEASDRAKRPADWFWLVGYLAGKALHASTEGNRDKALHHCISTAAALYNWHCAISGTDVRMSPGRSDLAEIVEREFPGEAEWQRDNDNTFNVLCLTADGAEVPREAIDAWTDGQCRVAEAWAGAVHLFASDNDDVIVPPMPDHVAKYVKPL